MFDIVIADATKARTKLDRETKADFPVLVKTTVAHDLQRQATKAGISLH